MDLDVTWLFQLGLFLICLVGLNGMILKPFLRVLQEREEKIEGARAAVVELTKLGDTDMEQYQARMRRARREAEQELEGFKTKARDEERRLLAETRAEIAQALNQARGEVAEAELEARQNLSKDTDSLARHLVSKVLGREVAA